MASCIHYGDIVQLGGRRGIVDRDWTRYPHDPNRRLILLEGGGSKWAVAKDVEKLPVLFLGMPNPGHAPLPGQPLTLWRQIPHGFDSYLWPDSWDRCLYCGLSEAAEIHPRESA
ncbi:MULTISPECIES: hypothetical protein [Streptomyces]|uniref:hypothetical protein n=1 Tax=Streptomyces TaxID=1883 RepID=UPI0004CD2341|nr:MULTISPECIES: hypothetical protein [Streptomyces]KOT51135.1 hypothetical protein ADK43_32590 [Streptomyces rimosus subsp. rimosus]